MAEEREDQTATEMVENAEQTEGKAVENHQTGKEQEVAVVEDVKGDAMDIEEKGKLEAGIGTKENEKAEDKELEGAKEELVQLEEGKEEEKTEKEEEEVEKEEEEEEEREEEEKEEEEEEERAEEENGTPVSTKKRPGRVKKGRKKSEEISTPRGSSGKRQRQRKEIFPFFTDRPTRERKSIERFIAFVEKDTNKEVQIKKVYNITRWKKCSPKGLSQKSYQQAAEQTHISSTQSFFFCMPFFSPLPRFILLEQAFFWKCVVFFYLHVQFFFLHHLSSALILLLA